MSRSDDHSSPRRDAWRVQLLQEQVAEEMARRRHAVSMQRAVMLGVALGLLGSFTIYLA